MSRSLVIAAPPPLWRATLLSLSVGVGVSAQTFVNGRLSDAVGSVSVAASINTFVALIVVVALALASGSLPKAWRTVRVAAPTPSARLQLFRPWWFLGGLMGAAAVFAVTYAVSFVGLALITVALVLGQLIGSFLADALGLGAAGRQPLTVWRASGLALALAAVAIGAIGHTEGLPVAALLLCTGGGVLSALQQAGNGQIIRVTGQPLAMSVINFAVASFGFGVVLLFTASGVIAHAMSNVPPWAWVGGVIAAFIGTIAGIAVRTLGVVRLMLGIVAGQSLAALVFDSVAPRPGHTIGALTIAGVALSCLAVIVASRRARPPIEQSPSTPEPLPNPQQLTESTDKEIQ